MSKNLVKILWCFIHFVQKISEFLHISTGFVHKVVDLVLFWHLDQIDFIKYFVNNFAGLLVLCHGDSN